MGIQAYQTSLRFGLRTELIQTLAASCRITVDKRNEWEHTLLTMKNLTTTGRIEPANVNLLNAAHTSFAPIQGKTAILYVSGSRQVTEFRVSDAGFSILVWEAIPVKGTGHRVELLSYQPASPSANGLWKQLEVDCLSGHARLSDRAPVRGVGGNPANRSHARATDDVATVCHWITRSEKWLAKRLSGQRKAILKANNALTDNAESSKDSKIPFLPPSMEFQLQAESELNRDVYANVMPQFLNVGSVKHWDNDGALCQRGKRVSSGSTTRTLAGKRDRIAILRAMALRQLTKAAEYEIAGQAWEADIYAEMAAESDAKAQVLQDELCARMAVARAARKTKHASLLTVTARSTALANVQDEVSGLDAARKAALAVKEAEESDEIAE